MILEGEYNSYIVILSVVIANAVSYISLNISSRIIDKEGKQRKFWLVLGSVVMGLGIWAFHFIGMLAFRIDIPITYDLVITLLSVLASFIASFIAFYITSVTNVRKLFIAVGGIFLALGIVSMHYIGMIAMDMPAILVYDNQLFALSIVIAFVASYAALFLFLHVRKRYTFGILKIISSIVMGGAISGMHYTGMAAVSFRIDSEDVIAPYTLDTTLLYAVIFSVIILFGISWIVFHYDHISLEKIAYQDPLTQLNNRHEMNRTFHQLMNTTNVGVVFIDLVQFKLINDTLGHHSGDEIIRQVANRLYKYETTQTIPFRIGGDEFLFIVKDSSKEEMESFSEDLLQTLSEPYTLHHNELRLKSSIGVSIGSITEDNLFQLLEEADLAMYVAKRRGSTTYLFYDDELGAEMTRRNRLITDLQTARENKELFLMYQPKWHVTKDELYGFEALLRWEHPQLGLISPAEFIPIAEETGEIVQITYYIIEQVLKQMEKWRDLSMEKPVSINLSTKIFQTDDFIEKTTKIVRESAIDTNYLEFEITESMVFHDIQKVRQILKEVRALGIGVSMDDFGTGYSSIGLLDRIPLDSLKLDRLFTVDLQKKEKQAIVKAILLMARTLNLDVIAEGVETKDQLDMLQQLGCEIVQGYYFYKPYRAEVIDEWLLKQKLPIKVE